MKLIFLIFALCTFYVATKAAVSHHENCLCNGIRLKKGIYQYNNFCGQFECFADGTGQTTTCGAVAVDKGCEAVAIYPKANYPKCCQKKTVCKNKT